LQRPDSSEAFVARLKPFSMKTTIPEPTLTGGVPVKKTVLAISSLLRWKIIALLLEDPRTSSELARKLGRTPNAITKHLAVLIEAGIIYRSHGKVCHLAKHLHPPPGSTEIDLGPCVLRLDRVH
jgi:DNA-binding transcriptional ArsR family regulator